MSSQKKSNGQVKPKLEKKRKKRNQTVDDLKNGAEINETKAIEKEKNTEWHMCADSGIHASTVISVNSQSDGWRRIEKTSKPKNQIQKIRSQNAHEGIHNE